MKHILAAIKGKMSLDIVKRYIVEPIKEIITFKIKN